MGISHGVHAALASFWRECYRDLRRHSGNERLPYPVRTALRDMADRTHQRCAAAEVRAIAPRLNRLAIRTAATATLSAGETRRAQECAAALGITEAQPIVVVETLSRPDLWAPALAVLRDEGYQVVRLRAPGLTDPRLPAVIDVATDTPDAPLLERHLVARSAFVVCTSSEGQSAAYAAGTPSLRLDARDPITAYPIRSNGIYTLATVIDLDTGHVLGISELLTARYFRNSRNCGYRPTGAEEIAAAVAEMIDGVRHGWRDTDAQARFRRAVADAGVALASQVRDVIEWDASGGFVGDGRLARVQAERAR